MTDFLKNTEMSIFIYIHPMRRRVVPCGRKEGRTDVQTDINIYTKIIVAFRNYVNASKNDPKYSTATFDPIRRKSVQIMQSSSDRLTVLKFIHFRKFTKEPSDSHCYIAVMHSFSTFSQTFFFHNLLPVICNL